MDDTGTPNPATHFFPGVAPEDIDLYATLGLTKEAKTEDIKKAFRAKFQQAGFAYAVLSDETRRKRYDQTGRTDEGGGLEPGEGGWDAYFEDLFDNVIRGKSDETKKEYQSMFTNYFPSPEEEENGLKRQQKLGDDLGDDPRDLIWRLMGRNRSKYRARDVDSDDDLEATGYDLEQEELRSARIAKLEDATAEAEEKRREEEKKRRKAEGSTHE
ncbi:hypothetical protein FRC04_000465 [Tulasnella sp. 424]|nr:hypothetical protein FRC04_000465 [Tulasnella sp. 424]KAG8973894.1 hypothetical protein FRC05_008116 [Tulasnella sp. 425]